MRRIEFNDLRMTLSVWLRAHVKLGDRAAIEGVHEGRRDEAADRIANTLVRQLEVSGYRIVQPDIVHQPGVSHGGYPGRWGVDEPEPGEQSEQ